MIYVRPSLISCFCVGPKQYKLRLYPDLTHNKLCQYEVPQWDQAYALTLGREAVNPRPAEFAGIHNRNAPYSDGFISYSDGVHDDVNKTVYSALSWDPGQDVRDILIDYAKVYFRPSIAARGGGWHPRAGKELARSAGRERGRRRRPSRMARPGAESAATRGKLALADVSLARQL